MRTSLFYLLFFCTVTSFAFPWGHRYSTEQATQDITVDINTSFRVSVEWGEGDWDGAMGSAFGYGLSSDGTDWIWVELPWFEDGEGDNKRCRTDVSIAVPGKYYYAYRMIKTASGGISYSFGSDVWAENLAILAATSTLTVGKVSKSAGAWNTTSTWEDGTVPGLSDNVAIMHDIDLATSNESVNSVYVYGDKTLTIENTGELTIATTLTIVTLPLKGDGNLTVESDATGTGSLIVEGVAAGSVGVERYVTETLYHYVSSPVIGQALDVPWLTANSIVSIPAWQMFRYDEDNNYWIIYTSDGNPELFNDVVFVPARGYMVVRDGDGDLLFEGTPITTDVIYPATYTVGEGEGFNMVGNPFSSSIAINEDAQAANNFLADNAALLDNNYEAIYIWDEQPGYSDGRNDYKVICNSGFSGEGSGAQLAQDFAGPGQGFVVKVNTGGGNIKFNADTRKHASVNFYKSKESWPGVEVFVTNDNLRNSTVVTFNENMSNGLDISFDAAKIKGNPKVALYTQLIASNGEDFAVQALPELGSEDVIVPLGLDVAEVGVFEFSANLVDMEGYDILLEDRDEETFTNLKIDTYFADVTVGENGRFYLHFKTSTGIDDGFAKTENKIKVYSHKNIVRLEAEEFVTNGKMSVVNILGQKIMDIEFSGSEFQFNLNNPGAYIIKTEVENSIQTNKIIIY